MTHARLISDTLQETRQPCPNPTSSVQRLARPLFREGLLVGTSSALNVAAAIRLARELGPGKVVATVAVDTGLKYRAGELFATAGTESRRTT